MDTPPGARDRGTVIHEAIGKFNGRYPDELPNDPLRQVDRDRTRSISSRLNEYPEAARILVAALSRASRNSSSDGKHHAAVNVTALRSEIRGEIEVTSGERAFRLAATADRIEQMTDKRFAIIDYKTGRPPTTSQVMAGLIAATDARSGDPAPGRIQGLSRRRLGCRAVLSAPERRQSAGRAPAREFENSSPDQEADKALARLRDVVMKFESEDEGYRSFFRPMWMQKVYGDYDHLARVKEWSASGGEMEEPEGGEQ